MQYSYVLAFSCKTVAFILYNRVWGRLLRCTKDSSRMVFIEAGKWKNFRFVALCLRILFESFAETYCRSIVAEDLIGHLSFPFVIIIM